MIEVEVEYDAQDNCAYVILTDGEEILDMLTVPGNIQLDQLMELIEGAKSYVG